MRNAHRSISTELEVSALRFTRVGLLLAMGDDTHTIGLEFPNSFTQDEMITYVERTFSTGAIVILGFIAFTVGDVGLVHLNPDVDVEDVEAVIADLADAFIPEGHVAFPVIQDPAKGPCIVVPVDDNGEPDLGWVN